MGLLTAAWFERDIVIVEGPDAAKFLQGQVSQGVEQLAEGASGWSLLLHPGGKVAAWLRITRTADEQFTLDMAPGWAETVTTRLSRFKIRVKCEITEVPQRAMLSVRGQALPEGLATSGSLIVAPMAGTSIGAVGYDLIAPQAGDIAEPDGAVIDSDAVEADRIAHGIPEMGSELDDSVIPAEMGTWFVEESVNWTKGCYVGQELVARVDSRGSNTPRRLRGVALSGPASVGDEVVDGAGKVVGQITSIAGTAALARIGRATEPPAEVTVGGIAATVTELPATTA